MANVNEGIAVGERTGLDPNDPRDFEAIMEGRGVAKEAGEGQTPSTDVRSGLVVAEEPAQAREPQSGRFVAKEETPLAPAADTSTVAVDEANLSPEVAAYLARYGGDPAEALKAAANAASLIGRQGQELGATREELAELRGRLEQLTQMSVSPTVTLSNDEVSSQAQASIQENGYLAAATAAANVAHSTGDERAYNEVRELWALESPGAAMDFNTDFRMWQRDQRLEAAAPPAPEAWVSQAREDAAIKGMEMSLALALDGYSKEDAAAIEAQFETALEQMPVNVLQMVGSNDPEARNVGTKIVVDRATLLASRAPAPVAPVAAVAAAGTQDSPVPLSVQRKLAGAAVATGSGRPTAKSTATPESREEAITAFKKAIVEAETTSVSAGLTYGPAGS